MNVTEFFNNLSQRALDSIYSRALLNIEYKTFDITTDLKLLDELEDKKLKYFLFNSGQVYCIPLKNMQSRIFGFVFRNIHKKEFHSIILDHKYPQVFGLENFNTFSINKPILLCEGIKDVQVLKSVYPYSLAYLNSRPSTLLFRFLTQITNKIIVFPDKDRTGYEFIKNEEVKEEYKYYPKYYVPFAKDLGAAYDKIELKEKIEDWIRCVLIKEGII